MNNIGMEPIAIVTAIVLLQYFFFSLSVGQARVKTGVNAPAVTGDPVFERHFRVQQNTLELLVIFLPALWLFGYYVHVWIGAGLGLVFVVGRFLYRQSYIADPAARGKGFIIGMLAIVILLLGGLGGAIMGML